MAKHVSKKTRLLIWDDAKRLGGEDPSAVALLMASAIVGANADRVASAIKMPRAKARQLAAIARKNQIWVGSKVAGAEWFGKGGGTALTMDALVLEGLLEKATP